jgi:hypothetical protein
MYDVTLRRVLATIFEVENQKVLHNLCLFACSIYRVCNAYAPYCNPWPARFCTIFPHYLTDGAIFEKKVIEHKMCGLIHICSYYCKLLVILLIY